MKENDTVNHPAHYTSHPSGIECIQITRWMNFNLGNAITYIWRAGNKGNALEDLKNFLDGFHTHPHACKAAQRDRMKTGIQNILHGRWKENRKSTGLENLIALVSHR